MMKLLSQITPTRVIVDREGYGVAPKQAVQGYGITEVSVVFVRDDGWTLGAPPLFERVAHDLWPSDWTHFIRHGEQYPIEEYRAL